MKSMRDYFDAEMRLLHEAMIEFSQKYPAFRDRDPHVERLLEGFAFLTANIRQRLDDDVPEISEAFLQQCWPQLLFPFPSATILEFASRKKFLLPRSTEVQSLSVGDEKTICRFSTVAHLMLQPIKLVNFSISEPSTGGSILKFEFEKEGDSALENDLIFYLHADFSVSVELFWALTHGVQSVNVFSKGQRFYLGDQTVCLPAYCSENETLLTLCHRSFYGFYLLQDYFAFKEKYFFIKITGLQHIRDSTFSLEITVQKIFPAEMRIQKDNFKLHCVPAVNLHMMSSEPIEYTGKRFSYPLIVDTYRKDSMILQDIISVESIEHATGHKKNIEAFSDFYSENFYQLKFFQEKAYLALGGKLAAPSDISCIVKASQGHYPRQYLQEGIMMQIIDQSSNITVKNIVRPSRFWDKTARKNYTWQFMHLLSFQFSYLSDSDQFKKMLKLLNITDYPDNHKKIEMIQNIRVEAFDKLYHGAFVRGVLIKLSLKEEGFRSLADMCFWGHVLHQFFCFYAPINLFVETFIIAYPSQHEFHWKMQSGKREIL